MKVYLVMRNEKPQCILADKDAAEEYVAYSKELDERRKGKGNVYWHYQEFNLVYGQYR